jgi:hypothetical protein
MLSFQTIDLLGLQKREVLLEDEKPVASIVYNANPDFFELTSIHVDLEANRGKGFGTQLLQRVEEAAKLLKAGTMHVAFSFDTPDAFSFFRKHRFEIIGVTAGPKFLLRKTISDPPPSEGVLQKSSQVVQYCAEILWEYFPVPSFLTTASSTQE